MKIHLNFDIKTICDTILREQLDKLDLEYEVVNFGEVNFKSILSDFKLQEVSTLFNQYGITIIENHKSVIVQKIKDTVNDMIYSKNGMNNVKSSVYLADKLNHSYGYISNIFSEVTYTSVENYIIIQKIERVKQLLLVNELSLTEIAYQLNYSSVSHLSTQFKNSTGLTPSSFQRIIKKRKENDSN